MAMGNCYHMENISTVRVVKDQAVLQGGFEITGYI